MKITVSPDIEITIDKVTDTAQVGLVTINGADENPAFKEAISTVPGPYGVLRNQSSWNEIIYVLEKIKTIFPYKVEDDLPEAPISMEVIR